MAADLSRGACAGRANPSYAVADPFYGGDEDSTTTGKRKPKDYTEAAEICARCRIRDLCLADALTETVQWGYRAGMTPEQRSALTRGNPPVKSRGGHLSETEMNQRHAMHAAGATDAEIAAAQGVIPATIKGWRYSRNLPSNAPVYRMHTPEMTAMKWELYNRGARDSVIAEKVGISPDAVRRWRRREGLENNRTRTQVSA
jgi:hypothetical protein